jgi:hypothetical protein
MTGWFRHGGVNGLVEGGMVIPELEGTTSADSA